MEEDSYLLCRITDKSKIEVQRVLTPNELSNLRQARRLIELRDGEMRALVEVNPGAQTDTVRHKLQEIANTYRDKVLEIWPYDTSYRIEYNYKDSFIIPRTHL